MRLIDADDIVLDYSGLANISPLDFRGTAEYFAKQIDAMPTVDAIPVDFITEFKEDYCNAESDKCDIGIANALVELMLCWEDEQEGIEWRSDHERIPSKQQWIPVSERLPDKDGDYLIFDSYEGIYIDSYYLEDGTEEYGYKTFAGWQSCFKVIAWMPLPEPYRG